jgi:hypothetical protein
MSKKVLSGIAVVLCMATAFFIVGVQGQTRTKKPTTSAPRNEGASISLVATNQVTLGQTIVVEIQVNLGTAKYEDGSPAALGGYVVPIGYDPSVVEFVSVEGGETPTFSKKPIVTNPETANQKGIVIATAFTTENGQSMSLLSVAKLTFKSKKNGAAVFTIDPEGSAQHAMIASQLHNNNSLPIPATYKNAAVSINAAKRTTKTATKP